jgi:hypothetical protein
MLHQICMNRIGNDKIRQGMKIIFDDDNVHSSSCMLRKRWETFFYMWIPFSNVIAIMISWSVSWVVMHSFSHGQHNKWIPKSLMVWPHWHHERCATVGCGIPRQIHNVVKKRVEDKRNEGALESVNNQTHVIGLAHEWRHVCMTSEGMSTKREMNSNSFS